MFLYFIIGILLLALFAYIAIRNMRKKPQANDSVLKQRAIFNANEQRTFTRLCQTLPDYIVLSHLSFDSLLTTKFSHTRSKYRNMLADFVVLNQDYEVHAVVMLDDYPGHKRDLFYKEEILKLAGYRVFHFYGVPNPQQILEALSIELKEIDQSSMDIKKLELCVS